MYLSISKHWAIGKVIRISIFYFQYILQLIIIYQVSILIIFENFKIEFHMIRKHKTHNMCENSKSSPLNYGILKLF